MITSDRESASVFADHPIMVRDMSELGHRIVKVNGEARLT